jgi:hypothetical protein
MNSGSIAAARLIWENAGRSRNPTFSVSFAGFGISRPQLQQ